MPEREDAIDSRGDTDKRETEAKDNKVVKISGRKDDKKTVSNDPENDITIVTKVLEFLTGSDPSEATLGSLVTGQVHVESQKQFFDMLDTRTNCKKSRPLQRSE